MAVLLLEGVNCTGKSTLARLFAERTGLEIVKFGVAPTADPFAYFDEQLQAAADRNPSFIIDRCHLSNYAYQTMQQSGVLTMPDWQRLDAKLGRLSGWLILMTDDVFAIETRMKSRQKGDGADGWDRGRIAEVQQRFEEGYAMTVLEPKGQFTLSLFYQDGKVTGQFESILAQFDAACS